MLMFLPVLSLVLIASCSRMGPGHPIDSDVLVPAERNAGPDINEVYKAAMAGSPVAQFQMGNFFLDGLNVRKSDRHAMEWWEKAALQGYAPAQYYLGQMYFVGEGIKHDFVKGCSWIGSAARQGLRDAAAMYAARCAEP